VNRRLGRGIGFGATYQFSKSIDDASSLSGGGGGGGITPIQDAFNRRADRGISTIDQPHRVAITYNYELPFGTNKPFLSEGSPFKTVFGDWLMNGSWNYSSGLPLSIYAPSTCYTNITSVTNGTLRANATGVPVGVGQPSVPEWFNTKAFSCPVPGQYGNAGKDTVRQPGQITMLANLRKTFVFPDGRSFDVQLQMNNPLNMVQYNTLDSTLNSPTFGRVLSAAPMRRLTITGRYNF
jgi:hypothetical protein